MGQRHQLFIIAKIPHRDSKVPLYRCVVAMHHQWLYGRTALAACKAFLTLVRVKDNATIIRAELAAIASDYATDQTLPAYPAPFLTWLIIMALTMRNDDQYSSSASIEDPNMGSHDGDNNDGITVFDVTDPSAPTYCFVSIHGIEASVQVDVDVPVSAEAYVRAYYPEPSADLEDGDTDEENKKGFREQEIEVLRSIESFKGEKMIELWMLAEAWPGEYNEGNPEEVAQAKDDPQETRATDDPDVSPPSLPMPSLSEISLRKAITYADESGDLASLDIVVSLPGLGEAAILRVLSELDHLSTAALTILVNALSSNPDCEPDVLDLSRYSLTADQVVTAIVHFPKTKVLNLNGNQKISGTMVLDLLPSLPKLSCLAVYGCTGISLEDIDRVCLAVPGLEAVYHRALMVRSLEHRDYSLSRWRPTPRDPSKSSNRRPLFTFAMTTDTPSYRQTDDIIGCSIPWLSPRTIVVALNDLHDYLGWAIDYDYERSRPGEAFFSSIPRAPHVPFQERGLGNIPDRAIVSADGGWLYAVKVAGFRETSLHCGFVKYKFAGKVADGEKPALEEVEVMDLEKWLKVVDPEEEVEKAWVEKLKEKLSPSKNVSLITEERAREYLSSVIPLLTDTGDKS